MFKKIFILMLLGHVLGDFYTQTEKVAEKKKRKISWVLFHGVVYWLSMIIITIPIISFDVFCLDIMVSLFHLLIDIIKYFYVKKKKDTPKVFIIDQCAHGMCLIIAAYMCDRFNLQIREISLLNDFFETTGVSELLLCKWILGFLIIHKPANILIQKLIGQYKPKIRKENEEFVSENNVGRIIGSVERAIMFILIYMNQYSAIGLVLTAKSIARYDQIAKDKKFAEYYLLGTLISAGIVISCAVLLFGMG